MGWLGQILLDWGVAGGIFLEGPDGEECFVGDWGLAEGERIDVLPLRQSEDALLLLALIEKCLLLVFVEMLPPILS